MLTGWELRYNCLMKINVKHVAKLANLNVTDEELGALEAQLESTLNYIEDLDQVNTDNINPTAHVTGLENVTREDEVRVSLSQEQALSNTTEKQNNLFMVKGILDND